MMHRSAFRASFALLAALVGGCDDYKGPTGTTETGLQVTPAFRGVLEGDTVRLTATLDGQTVPVTWASETPAVATVSSTGLVTGVTGGFTAITATATSPAAVRSSSITVIAVPALTSGTGVTIASSGAQGSQMFRKITVPAGATNLTITIRGGTGDVDLYVRHAAVPTTSNYGCRSWEAGNTEDCVFPNPAAGVWYILLDLWLAYGGATLTATVTP